MDGDMDQDTLAVLGTKLDHLASSVDKIEKSLATSATVHVTRAEWELRNQVLDERIATSKSDYANLKEELREIEGRRAPWWTVLAAIGSAVAVLALAFQWIPDIVNK